MKAGLTRNHSVSGSGIVKVSRY